MGYKWLKEHWILVVVVNRIINRVWFADHMAIPMNNDLVLEYCSDIGDDKQSLQYSK